MCIRDRGRAFEQIRKSVAYPHLNVKIAGSHAGISTGEDGATHQCLEDIGIMRTIPGMVEMCIRDRLEGIRNGVSPRSVRSARRLCRAVRSAPHSG